MNKSNLYLAIVLCLSVSNQMLAQTMISTNPVHLFQARKNIIIEQFVVPGISLIGLASLESHVAINDNVQSQVQFKSFSMGGKYYPFGAPRRINVFRERFPYMRKKRNFNFKHDVGCYGRSHNIRKLLKGGFVALSYEWQQQVKNEKSLNYSVSASSRQSRSGVNVDAGYGIFLEDIYMGFYFRSAISKYSFLRSTIGGGQGPIEEPIGRITFESGIGFQIGINL